MIKRGHEPGAGLWSIPGGRIEPGETDADALRREMIEETGLTVQVGRLIGRVRRPGLNGAVIDIRDYTATVTGGTLRPGDDAADARWVEPGELDSLEITGGLVDALTSWGVLGEEQQLSSGFPVYSISVVFVGRPEAMAAFSLRCLPFSEPARHRRGRDSPGFRRFSEELGGDGVGEPLLIGVVGPAASGYQALVGLEGHERPPQDVGGPVGADR